MAAETVGAEGKRNRHTPNYVNNFRFARNPGSLYFQLACFIVMRLNALNFVGINREGFMPRLYFFASGKVFLTIGIPKFYLLCFCVWA